MAHYNSAVPIPKRLAWLMIPMLLLAGVAGSQTADPPARVASVNFLEGTGSVQVAGTEDWTDDLLNRPLTGGDRVWIEESSRAEMHVGSSALRLGARTAVQILAVDDQRVRLSLTAGSVNVRIRNLEPGDHFEISTPAGEVALLEPGSYRVDVDDSNVRAYVAVWGGSAEVGGPTGTQVLHEQESAELAAGVEPSIEGVTASSIDSLDLWAQDRDRREEQSRAAEYVSRDVVGYQDLDGYGQWVTEPTYGMVWVPVVAANWAPYHYGYWNWIAPWGWTWIASEPWGFAPCHYGRWVHSPHGWAWAPGVRGGPRPVYSPALVAWRGERYPKGNPDLTHGRKVGWIPLGFNEVYKPPFNASPGYVRAANLSNTHLGRVDIDRYVDEQRRSGAGGPDRRYANENVAGAYSTAPHEVFTSANPVGRLRVVAAPKDTPQPRFAPHETWRADPVDRPVARPVAYSPSPTSGLARDPTLTRNHFVPAPTPDRPSSERRALMPPTPNAAPPVYRQAQPVMREVESRQAFVARVPQESIVAPRPSRQEQVPPRAPEAPRTSAPAPVRSGESAVHSGLQDAPAPVGRSMRQP